MAADFRSDIGTICFTLAGSNEDDLEGGTINILTYYFERSE